MTSPITQIAAHADLALGPSQFVLSAVTRYSQIVPNVSPTQRNSFAPTKRAELQDALGKVRKISHTLVDDCWSIMCGIHDGIYAPDALEPVMAGTRGLRTVRCKDVVGRKSKKQKKTSASKGASTRAKKPTSPIGQTIALHDLLTSLVTQLGQTRGSVDLIMNSLPVNSRPYKALEKIGSELQDTHTHVWQLLNLAFRRTK